MPHATSSLPQRTRNVYTIPMLVNLASLLLLGAGVLHFIATPERLASHVLLGVCFILWGTLQIAITCALIYAPTKKIVLFGILFNTGLLVLWLLAQAMPDLAGRAHEPITLLSGMRKTLELISVELLLQHLRHTHKVEG